MGTVIRIIPPSRQLVADIVRTAELSQSTIKVISNRVVMLPRPASNNDFPRAA